MRPAAYARRGARQLAAFAALAVLASTTGAAVPGANPATSEASTVAVLGEAIYREGALPSGKALRAKGVNGLDLVGADAACVHCHRRSGQGGGEGRSNVRALPPLFSSVVRTGSELRAKPIPGVGPRAPYTAATLAAALRGGVDASGRSLAALMPRYDIDDEAVELLAQYLASLGSTTAPGVSDTVIRLATVVLPDADPQAAEAMLAVLRAFVASRNGGIRSEARRREAGSDWMYQSYRVWQLDVWRLEGPAETWSAQLASRYRENPVFALVSGIGVKQWQQVETFCQQVEMPCVLPNAPTPPRPGYYSVYFTPGCALEGAVLARHLDADADGGTVVQVFRSDDLGNDCAAALRAGLGGAPAIDVPVAPGERVADRLRSALSGVKPGYRLVLWLQAHDLGPVMADPMLSAGAREISASASIATADGKTGVDLPAGMRMVYPYDLPQQREVRLERARAWFRARKIALVDERVQANTLFAVALVGDVLGHVSNAVSRDHFLERLEHMASLSPNMSYYPRISLAPGQRFVSKGAYVVALTDAAAQLAPLGAWILPDVQAQP
jgi:hypothetical protein